MSALLAPHRSYNPARRTMAKERSEARELIEKAVRGDRDAIDALVPRIYDELRVQATHVMGRGDWNSTLSPTVLVHEAYLRLADHPPEDWASRTHFLALAGRVMRQVLVDHHRGRSAAKRGQGWERVTLSIAEPLAPEWEVDPLELEELLDKLAAEDERQARIVELRFFAGLTVPEVAQVMGLSAPTVEREWRHARAWLRSGLAGDAS